jgi:transposase
MTPLPNLTPLSSAEKDVFIAVLLEQVEALIKQIADLTARCTALEAENKALREKLDVPPKTPRNSSKPPSSATKANGDPAARSKNKVHAGSHRPLHPSPTRRRDIFAELCSHCQADVSDVCQVAIQAYDRIEIPEIKPDVTRVTLHGGMCPCCARRFKAVPPAGLEPGSPFGPNLRAFVVYLRFGQAIPFERLGRLLLDLFGLEISEGALANMLEDSRSAFEEQVSRIRQRLLAGTILQSDETSVRVANQTFWTWVFHDGDSACFVIRPSRGKAVIAEFLGDARPEIWVSDRLAAQMGWATKAHQVCLAHLLRDVQYAIDAGDDAFAPAVKALLKRAVRIGQRRPDLADSTLVSYLCRFESKLDDLLKIVPTTEAGQKLQRIIKKYRQNLFVFMTNRAVPPTNNGSEQALRPCVIFRKVTNCFRSKWGAELYAHVRSVIETARRRCLGVLDAIRLTLDGTPLPAAE